MVSGGLSLKVYQEYFHFLLYAEEVALRKNLEKCDLVVDLYKFEELGLMLKSVTWCAWLDRVLHLF